MNVSFTQAPVAGNDLGNPKNCKTAVEVNGQRIIRNLLQNINHKGALNGLF